MNDVIYRQAAIGCLYNTLESYYIKRNLMELQNVRPNNQINLCNSCNYLYPDCPSESDDVIFGNGKGNDNICACSKYLPSAQQEQKKGKWERHNTYYGDDTSGFIDPDWGCSECGKQANLNERSMYDLTDFCPNCGADMRGE